MAFYEQRDLIGRGEQAQSTGLKYHVVVNGHAACDKELLLALQCPPGALNVPVEIRCRRRACQRRWDDS